MMMRWTYLLLLLGMLSLQAHPWLHDSHDLVQVDQPCVGCHVVKHGAGVDTGRATGVRPVAAHFPRPPCVTCAALAAAFRQPEIRGPPVMLVS